MRTFIAGDGSDSTAAVRAFLASTNEYHLADLYLIGQLEDPDAQFLTEWEAPLSWPVYGTFKSSVIKRSGITSQYGFEVDNLDVTWSPPLTAFGTTGATANVYQKAQLGVFDNRQVLVWNCIMPRHGDANTLGATPWFGGYIANTEVSRLAIKFSVQSFLNVVNQKTPPNVIEASNILSQYSGNVPVLADLEKNIPTFTVVAPSNTNIILGDAIQPHAHKIYGPKSFTNGFMVFLKGSTLAGYWSPVAANTKFAAGGGVLYNQFQVFGSFPFAPTPGDTFYVSTQLPTDFATASTLGLFRGFPFVPDPTTAIAWIVSLIGSGVAIHALPHLGRIMGG